MRTEVAVVQTEAKYLRGINGVFLAAAAIIVIKCNDNLELQGLANI